MTDKLRVLESMAKSTGNSVIQWAADEIARLTAERDAAIRERRAANEEVEDWSRRCGRILDERDEARARVAELEAAPAASGAAVGTCNTFCGERECERTDPTQCKRGEPQPARGGLTAEGREASTEAMKCMTNLRRERDEARAECERLRVAHLKAALERDRANEARGRIRSEWTRRGQALHAAQQAIGALNARVAELEAAPPPRGWLTKNERSAVESACDYFAAPEHDDDECAFLAAALRSLLARSTPPRVRRPNPNVVITTVDARERIDRQWIAAIRAAGGEVEE